MKQCMPCGVPMIALYPFQADRLAAIERLALRRRASAACRLGDRAR
jgi:hypothetical protein